MYPSSTPRILRIRAVVQITGLPRSTIYRLMSQSTFPKNIKLSTAAVGWDMADIELWLSERKRASIH
ncbi:MAG: AlpA family phage regulatory protein [Thiobacillus sp.]|nr:AlpA family phage regulatory protein [Thiobacillus sp.]